LKDAIPLIHEFLLLGIQGQKGLILKSIIDYINHVETVSNRVLGEEEE
jgi:hypothetical protein